MFEILFAPIFILATSISVAYAIFLWILIIVAVIAIIVWVVSLFDGAKWSNDKPWERHDP